MTLPVQRKFVNRRRVLSAALGTGAALATSGCRWAATGSADAGGTGVLRIAQLADIAPKSMLSQNPNDFALTRLVFDPLTEYDHRTLQPRPALATAWEWSDAGRTLTLQLREDVTFHTGRPFTAEDVVASIHAIQDPSRSSQLATTAALVTDLRTQGAHRIALRLSKPAGNLFDLFELMPIVDRETLADLASGKQMVGTGPFRFAKWTPGESVEFTRNPRYWKAGLPHLSGVQVRTIPQLQSLVASLRTGQSHLVPGLSPVDLLGLAGDDRFATTFTDTSDNAWYLGCNLRVPPLDRAEFRQALAYGIDRARIRDVVFRGAGTVTSLPWPTSSPAYRADLAAHYAHDPARARELLAAAGGRGIGLQLAYNSSLPATGYMAQLIQYDLGELGVDIELLPLLGNDFGTRLSSGKLPALWLNSHGFAQLNPASLVTGAAPFRYTKNTSGFTDPAYGAAAVQAWTTTGTAARQAYDELSRILLDQQFVISMVNTGATMTATTQLHGLAWTMFDFLVLDQARLG